MTGGDAGGRSWCCEGAWNEEQMDLELRSDGLRWDSGVRVDRPFAKGGQRHVSETAKRRPHRGLLFLWSMIIL